MVRTWRSPVKSILGRTELYFYAGEENKLQVEKILKRQCVSGRPLRREHARREVQHLRRDPAHGRHPQVGITPNEWVLQF